MSSDSESEEPGKWKFKGPNDDEEKSEGEENIDEPGNWKFKGRKDNTDRDIGDEIGGGKSKID